MSHYNQNCNDDALADAHVEQAVLAKQIADWKKELVRLASQIGFAAGKSCAVVLVQSADDDYAHVATDQILEDAVRVSPGYKIELLNPPN